MSFLISFFKYSLFSIIIFSFVSCNRGGCIDIEKSDYYYNEVKQWKYNDAFGNRTLVDNNGIHQTLMFMGSDSAEYDESVWDDCNQVYGSFSYSVQFNTSMSPFNFFIMMHAGEYIEKEYDKWPSYYIEIIITDTKNPENQHKNLKYDFVNKKIMEGEGNVQYLETYTVKNKTYQDVLEFNYDWMFDDNDIRKLYYAKKYGIIAFIDGNDNCFSVEENVCLF